MDSPEIPLDNRRFGFACAGLLALAGIGVWLLRGSLSPGLFAAAVVFAGLAAAAPRVFLPLARLWMIVARVFGLLTNRLILGAMFFLVITPLGILSRLVRKDPLARAIDEDVTSYWVPVTRQVTRETLGDQF